MRKSTIFLLLCMLLSVGYVAYNVGRVHGQEETFWLVTRGIIGRRGEFKLMQLRGVGSDLTIVVKWTRYRDSFEMLYSDSVRQSRTDTLKLKREGENE